MEGYAENSKNFDGMLFAKIPSMYSKKNVLFYIVHITELVILEYSEL